MPGLSPVCLSGLIYDDIYELQIDFARRAMRQYLRVFAEPERRNCRHVVQRRGHSNDLKVVPRRPWRLGRTPDTRDHVPQLLAARLAWQAGARADALAKELDAIRRGPKSSGQYREAVEMAEQGLEAGAVADSCGISRAEADLIVALYRSRNA